MLLVLFPPCLFISVFNFCQSDYLVSQCVLPWVFPAWDSLCFLDLVGYFLLYAREVSSYYLLRYFLRSFLSLLSFWNLYSDEYWCLYCCPRGVFRLSSFFFFHSFFYIVFCGSDFHHSVFHVTYLSFCLSYFAFDSL